MKKVSATPPVTMAMFQVFFRGSLPPSPAMCLPYEKTYFEESFWAAGPTNDIIIDPWVKYLEENMKVSMHLRSKLVGFITDESKLPNKVIASATIKQGRSVVTVDADVFVMAIPVRDAELVK